MSVFTEKSGYCLWKTLWKLLITIWTFFSDPNYVTLCHFLSGSHNRLYSKVFLSFCFLFLFGFPDFLFLLLQNITICYLFSFALYSKNELAALSGKARREDQAPMPTRLRASSRKKPPKPSPSTSSPAQRGTAASSSPPSSTRRVPTRSPACTGAPTVSGSSRR